MSAIAWHAKPVHGTGWLPALLRVPSLLPRKPKTRHRNPLNANALPRLFCQMACSSPGGVIAQDTLPPF